MIFYFFLVNCVLFLRVCCCVSFFFFFFFFFFSSRRRHTRWNCDWSSDVCSSDLAPEAGCKLERDQPLLSYRFAVVASNRFGRCGIVEALAGPVGVYNRDRGRDRKSVV